MNIRTGEMVRYATITIQTHGYLINLNYKFEYPVTVDQGMVVLENIASPISIPVTNMGKMILDGRYKHSGTQYVMVYPASMPEAEVTKLLAPQVKEWLHRLHAIYQTLLDNVDEMIKACDAGHDDHICKPMKAN